MLIHMLMQCVAYERKQDRQFVAALRKQGQSYHNIFSILLFMEEHGDSMWDEVVRRAIRQGMIGGYIYFERDSVGDWSILLTELGRRRARGPDYI